jgi:uncharacterized protein
MESTSSDKMKPFNKDLIDIVIYHHPCIDGFGAVYCVWYYFKTKFGLERANQIKYKPASHSKVSDDPSDKFYNKFIGKNVLMVDFTYKLKILQKILSVSNSLMVLDHHKSAEEDLQTISSESKIFDMKRSGAVLAWDYFFTDKSVPKFLRYIQDRDLWNNTFPDLNEFITYFNEIKFDFDLWETYLDEKVFESAIEKGRNWLDYKNILVNKSAKRSSRIIQIIDGSYVIVAYSNSSEFRSDIGSKIFDVYPLSDFSCVWSFSLHKNSTNFSLRSTNDRYDVKEIAVSFGGGGHRNASGVTLKGIHGLLPYPSAHSKYIDLIENITVNAIENDGFRTSYIIIDCTELGKKFWRHPEKLFVNLIKRKNKNAEMIVFQIKKKKNGTDLVQTYHIIYNDMFIGENNNKCLFDVKTLSLKIDSVNKINDGMLEVDNRIYFDNTFYSMFKN